MLETEKFKALRPDKTPANDSWITREDIVTEQVAGADISALDRRPKMRLPDQRVRLLIDAAMDEFLSKGFRRGSIENIARATGIGKATIYRHFTDKNGLFRAAVMAETERLETPPFDFQARAASPAAILLDFALQAIDLFFRDRSLTLHRMIIESAQAFPDLAHAVHDRLTEWSLVTLKPYLAGLTAERVLEIDDIDWAAHQFVNLTTHGILFLMTPPPANEAARRALAMEAVDIFIGGAPLMRAWR